MVNWRPLKEKAEEELARGKTEKDLAEGAAVSPSSISNLIRGVGVGKGVAVKLCDFLGVDKATLYKRAKDAARFAYCGSSRCPSICLAVAEQEIYVAPMFRRLTKSTPMDCPYCNSRLYDECPNCCEPIQQVRLTCPNPKCGEPYVPVPEDLDELPREKLVGECLRRNRMNKQLRRHFGEER